MSWYEVSVDKKKIAKEREEAQKLKKSAWWNQKLQEGTCHYCQKHFEPKDLTMDHIVPVSRGGKSSKNNIVPACRPCNQSKKMHTPVDLLLQNPL